MAIFLQLVIQSNSCSVLGFRGRQIERRYFRLSQIQDGSRPPSWTNFKWQYMLLLNISFVGQHLPRCASYLPVKG